jgi:subtilisin family serine protease
MPAYQAVLPFPPEEKHMTRRSSMLQVSAVAVGIATAAALTFATPANAAPAGGPAPTSPVVAEHTVTLVTGDVVLLRRLANGDDVATVKPAPDRLHTSFATREVNDQVYVVPTDAVPLLAADKLDEELFNVSALVANGYDDANSQTIPLIVQYAPSMARAKASAAPAGTKSRLTLESINAQSVHENKAEARTFWSSLAGSEPSANATANSIDKVWLNRKVQVSLTESVPQVGAPQAWQAGYDGTGVKVAVLDTGIDDTHPDLDGGKVAAAANFSSDADAVDRHGHGTHVASTVAGTGEGAPANRKGVAPGATLLNAKVLNSAGSGEFDQIIEGLEWAAAQGADVASMSLGTQSPSDGNDPLVQAVDQISQSSGMLIVIAAGNLGNGESTIASPGWADEALTVGAVTKQDALAGFSSRGPRLGDYGIKPDITAPGVDIVAARADGTALGPIVDERYIQISGTSMATPHVAGAAAIMTQAFPNYSNRQIKDALVSTARTIEGQTVYQQGGGRLDIPRAFTQKVYSSPGTLNLGFFPYPQTGQQPVTKAVTYSNDGPTDVTLNLSLQVSGKNTGPAPAGMFTVSQPTVTVPAGGTASVDVTVNPAAGALDQYGGYLVGTAGDIVVHTSVGAYVEPEMYNVTVSGIARDGRPAAVISWAEMWGLDTGSFSSKYYSQSSNTVTFRVPPGTYSLVGYLHTADDANLYALESTMVAKPQIEVTGDATYVLDARTANEVKFNTAKPVAPSWFVISYHRGFGERNFHSSLTASWPIDRAFATPTEPVTKGDFEFYTKWKMIAPPVLAKVTKPAEIPLDPQYMSNAVRIDGKHNLPLVYVGFGKPEDYVGRDVRGKIALISRGAGVTFADKVKNATNAGAWGAVIFNNVPGLLLAGAGNPGEVRIPAWTIEQAPGQMLVDMLQQGPVKAQFSGTSVSPYVYDLLQPYQVVPSNMTTTIDRNNTAQLSTQYVGDAPGQHGADVRHAIRPYPTFSVGFADDLPRPLHRTEWVSANDTKWWHLAWANYPFDGEFRGDHNTQYAPRTQLAETWFGGVRRSTMPAWWPVTREGNQFSMAIFPFVDSDGHAGWSVPGDVLSTKLYTGGQLLAESAGFPFGTFPAVGGESSYRLVFNGKRNAPWWRYATEVNTAWTFTSRPDQELPPLVQVDYDLALDALNQAPDRSAYTFTIDVGHQPGVNGPGIAEVQAWVSFNDGGTWRKVNLTGIGDGQLRATVQHPKAENTSGAVSLRIKATDAAGNGIDQTVIRAYGLRSTA